MTIAQVRVILPFHLRQLSGSQGEVIVSVPAPVTQRNLLDALEIALPVLRGTIREQPSLKRRAFVRFFACKQDLSNASPDATLPAEVASGTEPFRIVGAMSGG
ncbi:MAG: hypothetical protein R3D57_12465 [Hyphomicrobiaceae bacterium]